MAKTNKGSIRQLIRRQYSRPSVPMAIIGPPGMGKTAQVKAAAAEIGYECFIFIASTCDETDIAGLPILVDGVTTTATPHWAKTCGEKPCVLCFDELNRGRPEVLNAILTVLQDRVLPNGYKLHPHTIMIALMNDAAMVGAEELCPAMNNRFGWIEMTQPSEDEFFRWLNTGSSDFETVAERKAMEKTTYGTPEFKPITMEEWLEFYHASDENCADLKELGRRAKATELKFAATNEQFTQQRRICTARSLTNLFYFAGDAQHAGAYAKYFLDDRNANIIKTALKRMKDSASNVAMRSDREKLPTGTDQDRLENAMNVDAAVQAKTSFLSRALGDDED